MGLVVLLAGLAALSACQSGTGERPPAPNATVNGELKNSKPAAALQQTAPGEDLGPQAMGHQATIRCLRGERAMTDGDELRCEDWDYVRSNYR